MENSLKLNIRCIIFGIILSCVISGPITLIDLTYEFSRDMPTYPTHKQFESLNLREVYPKENDKEIRFAIQDMSGSEHAGTHMDAPFHFKSDGLTMEQIPIEHFTGPAVVINITKRARNNADAEVMLSDIQEWERQHGSIPDGSIVLMDSGWGKFWNDQIKYTGNDRRDMKELHFPGFHEQVCQWLVTERNINGIGVDTIAADAGYLHTIKFPCHVITARHGLFILENVANMDAIPSAGATVRAYPMKIHGGTGAPTRIIATLNDPRKARTYLDHRDEF